MPRLLVCSTFKVALIAVVAFWLHVSAPSAAACSCVEFSPAQAFERADSVFVGEVVSFNIRSGLFGQSSVDPSTVEFSVSEVWKGPRQETLTIRSVRSEASCGYEFQEGLRYLVYAREGQTGLCDGTSLAFHASEHLAALGDGWILEPATELGSAPVAEPAPDTDSAPRGNSCGAAADRGGHPDAAVLGLLLGSLALGIRRWPRL